MIPKRRIIARTGILDPIEFWWVPYMPEMVVPKSSVGRISLIFDRFMVCLAAPLVLWVPEGLPPCGNLWQPVATCGIRLDAPY